MANTNKVILVGNLGKDSEVRFTGAGQPVINLNVATNESWKDKAGVEQKRTEWHRVVLWGKIGEEAPEFKKAQCVYVEGRTQTKEWTDKEGKRQFSTEIVASRVLNATSELQKSLGTTFESLPGHAKGKDLGQPAKPEAEAANEEAAPVAKAAPTTKAKAPVRRAKNQNQKEGHEAGAEM